MIKQTRCRRGRLILKGFIVSLCLILLFTGDSIGLKQAEAMDRPAGKQLTPVLRSEKWLTSQINEKRRSSGLHSLNPDWDLFRFARTYAKELAEGKIQQVKIGEIDRMLSDLGRAPTNTGCLIIRASVNQSFPESWWQTGAWQRFAGQTYISQIGTGHASRGTEQVWVILYSKI
ncbi:MAG: hypothetical protein ACE3JK_12645 [Sporolactobacillus sp.]